MLIAVGSHSRKAGKTSVVCGLIRSLPEVRWTAVKVTAHEPHSAPPYSLEAEADRDGPHDTSRYLRAGAVESLWLRAREDSLESALPALREALGRNPHAILESSGILDFLAPDLYVFVLNGAARDFKPPARRFLARAGAIVVVNDTAEDGLPPVPAFRVHEPDWASADLAAFVRARI